MDLLFRCTRRRLTVGPLGALLLTLLALGGSPAQARAAGAISSALKSATGYSSSQLTTRPACGAAQPRHVRCLAQVLTIRNSGRPVEPLHPGDAAAGGLPRASSAGTAPQPFTPAFLQWAYDTTWLSANAGAGDTVAIVDAYDDPSAYTDLTRFRSTTGLSSLPRCTSTVTSSCFEEVNQNGAASPLPSQANDETGSWNIEESLDLDAVSSLCPRCKLLLVEANSDDSSGSPDLETGVQTAARLGASQISLSWGRDTPGDVNAWDWPYSSISSSAILAASGDGGYPGPEVGYPAALANVTAVGGTSLTSDLSGRGFSESAWSLGSCAGGTTCGTESGCDMTQSRPSYQSGITTDCLGRAYNDISADADPSTGLEIYDSQTGSQGCGGSGWCIIGGTSLATPLAAAVEALTGVAGTTPAWSYARASLLNDVVSGSDGVCPSGALLICNAAAGWDGPTGNGSVSGDLATGGPGIGGAQATGVNATDVTLSGGVYPNGESTGYHWHYWVNGNPAAATDTATSTVGGPGLQDVTATLCAALSPSTTYDYELVAANSSGTETGYQGSFTTAATESAPTAASAPAISGATVSGQTLVAQDADWIDQSCDSPPSYGWQEAPSAAGPWTTVSSGSMSYAVGPTDVGSYLRFVATESNQAGSTTLASPTAGPVTGPPVAPVPSSTTTTAKSWASGGAPPAAVTRTVRFYRCLRRCVLIANHGSAHYHPRRADQGRYIKVVTMLTRITASGRTTTISTRWLGPVTGVRAGDVGIGPAAHLAGVIVIRGSSGRALADVRIARRSGRTLTLVISRATRAPTKVWGYLLGGTRVLSGTNPRRVIGPLTLRVTLRRGQTLKLVASAS